MQGERWRRLTEFGVNVSLSIHEAKRALFGDNGISDLRWDCLTPGPTNCCQLHQKPTGPNKHSTVLSVRIQQHELNLKIFRHAKERFGSFPSFSAKSASQLEKAMTKLKRLKFVSTGRGGWLLLAQLARPRVRRSFSLVLR
jgi:hypothetical protein